MEEWKPVKNYEGYVWSFTELTEPQGVSNNAQS